jgi:hypothetical protein
MHRTTKTTKHYLRGTAQKRHTITLLLTQTAELPVSSGIIWNIQTSLESPTVRASPPSPIPLAGVSLRTTDKHTH